MRVLKKVIGTILILMILQGFKMLINENSSAISFYYNLTSSFQVLIFLWCCISLLLEELALRQFSRRIASFASFGVFIVLITLAEGTCTYWLNHPGKIPASLFSLFKVYYDDFDCRVFQYEPTHTRFSPTLFYEMKGQTRFVFANREFSDSFQTNSAGLRDDESSLSQPDIICVGDSYTMGWGNSQENNFPALIEQRTGLKVLNVSMSSYGTAREMLKLQQIDLSRLRYLFWQYCSNDQVENKEFINHGYALPVRPYKSFDSVVQLHKWTRKYFPFRHFLTITKLGLRKAIFGKPVPSMNTWQPGAMLEQQQKVIDFLEIIERLPLDYSKTRVVVFELRPYPLDNGFALRLDEAIRDKNYEEKFKGNFSVVDFASILERKDFYLLDVHVTKPGNEKIVSALLNKAGL